MSGEAMEQTSSDPLAVIMARVEVKLDNALDEQKRHGTELGRHDGILVEHGNRLTALETAATTSSAAGASTASKVALWIAGIGLFLTAMAALATVLVDR